MTGTNETGEGPPSISKAHETLTDKSSHVTDLESGEGAAATSAPTSDGHGAAATFVPPDACPDPNRRRESAVALLPATPAFNYKATKAPKETLEAVYKAGVYKAGLPLNLLMMQSFMAGVYISMAGQLFLTVGGGVLGASLFPTGLIAVVLTSAELFTGDALVFIAAFLGGKVSLQKLLRNWTVSWIMNFVGCLFWAGLLAYASGALQDSGQADLAVKVAEKKAHQPWVHIFLKGIGANFMVCIGVWQATCAEEVSGKVLSLWFPIAAFVMLGFDHCIANQFLIPVGMMFGADVTVGNLFWALLPATIGNAVGGGLMVGAFYWYVYDSMASSKQLVTRIREGLFGHGRLSVVTYRNDGEASFHDEQRHEAKHQ
jgi:formate transporter